MHSFGGEALGYMYMEIRLIFEEGFVIEINSQSMWTKIVSLVYMGQI